MAGSLIDKRSFLSTIIARAPFTTFVQMNSTGYPRIKVFLGTFLVFGLEERAAKVIVGHCAI